MLTLLPDDPKAADQVVRLTNQVHALKRSLDRTLHERNTWRENFLSLSARMERLGVAQAEVAALRSQS